MVRSVSEVLSLLGEVTGHSWRVEDTGGGCEVFYSDTFDAIITLDAGINFDRRAGGVFDSSAEHWNWDNDYVETEDDLMKVEDGEPWFLYKGVGGGDDAFEVDLPEHSAMTLTEIVDYLRGLNG